jgi:hypothetical protein
VAVLPAGLQVAGATVPKSLAHLSGARVGHFGREYRDSGSRRRLHHLLNTVKPAPAYSL